MQYNESNYVSSWSLTWRRVTIHNAIHYAACALECTVELQQLCSPTVLKMQDSDIACTPFSGGIKNTAPWGAYSVLLGKRGSGIHVDIFDP